MGALYVSHYLWVIFAFQVIAGILLLVNRYVPLAVAVLAPVMVNILVFHSSMAVAQALQDTGGGGEPDGGARRAWRTPGRLKESSYERCQIVGIWCYRISRSAHPGSDAGWLFTKTIRRVFGNGRFGLKALP